MIRTILTVLACLFLTVGLVACSDDDDDGDRQSSMPMLPLMPTEPPPPLTGRIDQAIERAPNGECALRFEVIVTGGEGSYSYAWESVLIQGTARDSAVTIVVDEGSAGFVTIQVKVEDRSGQIWELTDEYSYSCAEEASSESSSLRAAA
ncbi:MAG: hypothetical protein AAGN46_01210 [Acidobacteriota bacterium]